MDMDKIDSILICVKEAYETGQWSERALWQLEYIKESYAGHTKGLSPIAKQAKEQAKEQWQMIYLYHSQYEMMCNDHRPSSD